jgi:hypothetical protein
LFERRILKTQNNVLAVDLASLKFIGLAYQGKDIVLRFVIEFSSLRDFDP